MRPTLRRICRTVVVTLTLVLLLAVIVFVRYNVDWPMRYELPAGYRGWVIVKYEDPTCPPMRSQGFYWVIRISPGGRACTSSETLHGWTYHRLEYVDPDGTRAVAPGRLISYGNKGGLLFIGTEEELRDSWRTVPR